ncbi:MAG: response regulator transcription factor [Deltaproteobacteria bacterium]|jgi:DNA-binding CsgD family transcriptional regulator|nr:response regulator transcription factor [Deltaproteobacteria bacterium]
MELTAREIDVLIMLAERLSNKEIAERLFISAETVKKHTTNIYRKLDVHGRRQAVAAAHQRGFLPVK